MRGTINLISRTVALLVVFTIGFATLAGFMVGGGYLAFTKISIDALQELGFDINTDKHFDKDAAQVDITALTIKDMVSEIVLLSQLSDVVSIQYLTDRYGVKATSKLPSFITQKYKDMPIKVLFTEETKQEFLNTTMVGDMYSYEKTDNPEYDAELDEGNPYIWKDGSGAELIGLSALMASYTLSEILSISKDPSVLTGDLAIAEILDLRRVDGLPIYIVDGEELIEVDPADLSKPIDVWVDPDGALANGVIGSIAELKITEVESGMDSLTIGDITSLVSYSEQWYMWSYDAENSRILLEEKNDISAELADVTIADVSNGGLSDAVMDVSLSSVLGYTQDEDGKWYKDGEKVSGLMASMAPYKVGEIDSKIGTVKIGEISDYTYDEENGVWLDENSNEATGILAALADLTVDQVSDEEQLSAKIQTVNIADIMGYKKDENGNWCTVDEEGNMTAVTGIMKVIADSPINQASETIDGAYMADILSYTAKLDEDGNIVYDSNGNIVYLDSEGNEVHVLMQKIARTKFADIDTITEDLTVADLIPENQRDHGYISLIPSDTTLDALPAKVDETFQKKSIYSFIEAGVVTFEDDEDGAKRQQVLEAFDPNNEESPYKGMTIPELLLTITTPASP